jgi:hypothetical protein
MFAEMQSKTVPTLIICFSALFVLAEPVPMEAVSLPIVMNSQGFTIAITYYSITNPNTIVLVGSIENDGYQTVKLTSLTATPYIHEVNVGSGSLDQQYLTLTGGVVVPASATITTRFNIYMALGTGVARLEDGSMIPVNYTTPVTITVSALVCVPKGSLCLPWLFPLNFNQTSTLSQL